jgi:hypothetical protein
MIHGIFELLKPVYFNNVVLIGCKRVKVIVLPIFSEI